MNKGRPRIDGMAVSRHKDSDPPTPLGMANSENIYSLKTEKIYRRLRLQNIIKNFSGPYGGFTTSPDPPPHLYGVKTLYRRNGVAPKTNIIHN